jgi:hypothetical protein
MDDPRRRKTNPEERGESLVGFERSKANDLDRESRRIRDGVDRLLKNRGRFPFSPERADDRDEEP